MNTPDYIQELHIPDTIMTYIRISPVLVMYFIYSRMYFVATGIPRTYLYYGI